MKFPDTFILGAASASYQVEGSSGEKEGGLCVWIMKCRNGFKGFGILV